MNFFVHTHIVQQGETLDDIIQKYKIPSVEILRYFHNQNVVSRDNLVGNKVFKGQEIFIPTPQDIGKIEIEGKNGLYNWVFFLQPKWYETTKYIDPELTLYMNGIEENSVVFCVRSEQLGVGKEKGNTQYPVFEYNQEQENNRRKRGLYSTEEKF